MVISERHAYSAYRKTVYGREEFAFWGASQRLTTASQPLARGTRSNGGGLIPLRYALMGK
jgi:hypothetical protein